MQVTRKIAAAAAVATVATLGLATMVSANVIDDTAANTGLADAASVARKVTKATDGYGGVPKWYWVKDGGSLVPVNASNVGPFQACQNFVDGVAGQVPVSDITGVVGVLNNGSTVTAVKTCEQDSTQANGDWYRLGADGVVSVSGNNAGPFQVCHNEVPVDGVTSQLPVGDLAVILGLVGNSDNGTDVLKTCDQGASQNK
jgi:hypothetical protein